MILPKSSKMELIDGYLGYDTELATYDCRGYIPEDSSAPDSTCRCCQARYDCDAILSAAFGNKDFMEEVLKKYLIFNDKEESNMSTKIYKTIEDYGDREQYVFLEALLDGRAKSIRAEYDSRVIGEGFGEVTEVTMTSIDLTQKNERDVLSVILKTLADAGLPFADCLIFNNPSSSAIDSGYFDDINVEHMESINRIVVVFDEATISALSKKCADVSVTIEER